MNNQTIVAVDPLLREAADAALSVGWLWRMPEATRDYFLTLDPRLLEAAVAGIRAGRPGLCDVSATYAWTAANWLADGTCSPQRARERAANYAKAAEAEFILMGAGHQHDGEGAPQPEQGPLGEPPEPGA